MVRQESGLERLKGTKVQSGVATLTLMLYVLLQVHQTLQHGDSELQGGLQLMGLNFMDKILFVRGARIAYSIWDVGGDVKFVNHVLIAVKDAVVILIMFDLTSRFMLNNAVNWYQRARKWNKIPILIGTKFDDFVQLPLEMQWTVVKEGRQAHRTIRSSTITQNGHSRESPLPVYAHCANGNNSRLLQNGVSDPDCSFEEPYIFACIPA